jgi:hypothetical protein
MRAAASEPQRSKGLMILFGRTLGLRLFGDLKVAPRAKTDKATPYDLP